MLAKLYDVLEEEIGRGRFGIVSKCKCRLTGDIYAIKTINKSLISDDTIDTQSLINEPKALRLLSRSSTSSFHITRLHDIYNTPTHLHLILDFFPSPTLYDIVSHRQCIPEPESRSITFSLLQCILHCHQHGVVHRDIKPENILYNEVTRVVKICDFGSCGFLDSQETRTSMNEVVGTPYYVAPEILEGNGYDEKVDVWSAGVVLYVMLAGFPPFYGDSVEEIFEKVLRGNLRFPSRVFGNIPGTVKDLLRKMLCKDVSKRLTAIQALGHPWFMTSEGHFTA